MESLQNKVENSRMSWFGEMSKTYPWNGNESDDEYEEGNNETPIKEIDPIFINHIMRIKQIMYDLTVNAQPLGTPGAQTMDSLNDFENRLINVHTFLISDDVKDRMQKNKKIKETIQFPEGIRQKNVDKIIELGEELHETIDNWILTQYNRANTEDLPPYTHFMKQKLTMCPHEFNKGWCKKVNEIGDYDEMEI